MSYKKQPIPAICPEARRLELPRDEIRPHRDGKKRMYVRRSVFGLWKVQLEYRIDAGRMFDPIWMPRKNRFEITCVDEEIEAAIDMIDALESKKKPEDLLLLEGEWPIFVHVDPTISQPLPWSKWVEFQKSILTGQRRTFCTAKACQQYAIERRELSPKPKRKTKG